MAKKKPALTEVPDFNGNPTRVGDKVVYIHKTYCTSELRFGEVVGLSKVFGRECVVINECGESIKSKPTSQSFYRVNESKSIETPNPLDRQAPEML